MNTDILTWVGGGQASFIDLDSTEGMTGLGSVDAWTRSPHRLACGRTDGHYFARLLP